MAEGTFEAARRCFAAGRSFGVGRLRGAGCFLGAAGRDGRFAFATDSLFVQAAKIVTFLI